jgi:hypothetical protein
MNGTPRTPLTDQNSHSKHHGSCPEFVVPVDVARAIEIEKEEWKQAAKDSLLSLMDERDAAIDALKTIFVSTWKTSGELRTMARNAVHLVENLNQNKAKA